MSPKSTVRTKCPVCEKKYNVPASSVGHRARCASCNAVFRVKQRATIQPTEDDIMRWLSEASEETERHDPHPDDDSRFNTERSEPSPQQPGFEPDISLMNTKIRLRKTG